MSVKKAVYTLSKIRDKYYPKTVAQQVDKLVYNYTDPRIKHRVLIKGIQGKPLVFCIVHFNAPDFLLLTVNQIELLYPESKIYVLDNGSEKNNVWAAKKGLEQFSNVTLFAASTDQPNWKSSIGLNRLLYSHAKGLQFLLNYASEQKDEVAIFLDQDCILTRKIDDLCRKLGAHILLVGARLTGNFVHASFMIMQPQRISELFGKYSLFHDHTSGPEPYQGICFKAKGKILFLEGRGHSEIPFLTSYSINDIIYAWHAWYSSRLPSGVSDDASALKYGTVRNRAYDFMETVYKETALDFKEK